MALIECPECGREVSDRAKACPKCACPVGRQVQTVERTGKAWKLVQLVGAGVSILATVWTVAKLSGSPEATAGPQMVGILLGLAAFIVGRIGAWWFHG